VEVAGFKLEPPIHKNFGGQYKILKYIHSQDKIKTNFKGNTPFNNLQHYMRTLGWGSLANGILSLTFCSLTIFGIWKMKKLSDRMMDPHLSALNSGPTRSVRTYLRVRKP
jgi:hypothetical protein